MGRVPVTVVHIVHVVAVRHRRMPAALAVRMGVTGVLLVPTGLALVHVTVVVTVQMAFVRVVDVIVVGYCHMPAALAVHMVVSGVRPVLKGCCHAAHLPGIGPPRTEGGGVQLPGHSYPYR